MSTPYPTITQSARIPRATPENDKSILLDFSKAGHPFIDHIRLTPTEDISGATNYRVQIDCANSRSVTPEAFLLKFGQLTAVLAQFADQHDTKLRPSYIEATGHYKFALKLLEGDVKKLLDIFKQKQFFPTYQDEEILKTVSFTERSWQI